MKFSPKNDTSSSQHEIDIVISKIRELITSRQLEPGEKLPSERALSKKFDVSRSQLRIAIQKLEFYGLLKKYPKSGTIVSKIGVDTLSSMMTDILKMQLPDFKSLVETRLILETKAVRLAALRRNDKHLDQIQLAHDAYIEKSINGQEAVDEDLLFHLKLCEASCNSVINSLMLVITPKIITHFVTFQICEPNKISTLINEHQNIIDAIKEGNPDQATECLKIHFKDLYRYCNNSKIPKPIEKI